MRTERAEETTECETHVLSVCGISHRENEDAGVAWRGDDGTVALVVSDGMGGHVAGRRASSLVVRACLSTIRQRVADAPWSEIVRFAVEIAHTAVHDAVQEAPELESMGATVVVVVVEPGVSPRLHVAHVGDSRAYLVRGRSLYRLTGDHSLVSRMVADGLIAEDEAFGHPDSNVLERAVGQWEALEVDVQGPTSLDPGDLVFVCSDGLHAVLPDIDLAGMIAGSDDLERLCRDLHAAAVERGSIDDVTIGCVRLPASRRPVRDTRVIAT